MVMPGLCPCPARAGKRIQAERPRSRLLNWGRIPFQMARERHDSWTHRGIRLREIDGGEAFRREGFRHVDSDIVVREQVLTTEAVRAEIRKRHGGGVFTPEGQVDRPALGKIVFSDDSERLWLEELTHPIYFAVLRGMFRASRGRNGRSRCPFSSRSRSRIGLISRSASRVIPFATRSFGAARFGPSARRATHIQAIAAGSEDRAVRFRPLE